MWRLSKVMQVFGNSEYWWLMWPETSPHSSSGTSRSVSIERSAEQFRRCGPNASNVSAPP